MGGGSSVMGMVALRGTPDDYAEWEEHGAAGWGWNDVLPFFNKLEKDFDFAGDLHGADGPVPVRRTPKEQWPPLSKALQGFADERQYPYVADMNADFRDGYASVPMSNWPDKRASAAICYLDADVRARPNLTIFSYATATELDIRRQQGNRRARQRDGRAARIHRPRDHRQPRRHPFVGHADARRHRPGGALARAWHCGTRRSAGRRLEPFEPFAAVHRLPPAARRAAIGGAAAAPQHRAALFIRRAGLPAHRHVHQRAEQDLVERARLADRQSCAGAVEADGPRPRRAALGRSPAGAAGRDELRRP